MKIKELIIKTSRKSFELENEIIKLYEINCFPSNDNNRAIDLHKLELELLERQKSDVDILFDDLLNLLIEVGK